MNPDILVLDSNLKAQSVQKDMSHFLNLLQKSIGTSNMNSGDNILIETDSQYSNSQSIQQSNKLSIILSASEGASSEQQGRKDNYDEVSMNQFGSSSLEDNFIRPLIRKKTDELLEDCTLSTTGKMNEIEQGITNRTHRGEQFIDECNRMFDKKNEQQMVDYFNSVIKDYIHYIEVLEKRNNENLLKKEKYRTKCQHLFRAFVTGREEEKRLLESYIELKDKIEGLQELRSETQLSWLKTSKQLQISRSENMYLKQLIFIANKNYESLEKKYLESEERFKYSEIAMKQKQIHFIEGNSVLKDVILNLQKERKSLSKEKSRDRDRKESKEKKQHKENKENKENKQNKQNKHVNKHKSSKSISPQQKVVPEEMGRKEEIDDTYRRMFMKTLRGN